MLTNKELYAEIKKIEKQIRLFDLNAAYNSSSDIYILTQKQANLFESIIRLFKELSFKKNLMQCKEVCSSSRSFLDLTNCGIPVKCQIKNTEATYYVGILIGHFASRIDGKIKDNKINLIPTLYESAIFIPELNTIINGNKCVWKKITENDLTELINGNNKFNKAFCLFLDNINPNVKEFGTKNELRRL